MCRNDLVENKYTALNVKVEDSKKWLKMLGQLGVKSVKTKTHSRTPIPVRSLSVVCSCMLRK